MNVKGRRIEILWKEKIIKLFERNFGRRKTKMK